MHARASLERALCQALPPGAATRQTKSDESCLGATHTPMRAKPRGRVRTPDRAQADQLTEEQIAEFKEGETANYMQTRLNRGQR